MAKQHPAPDLTEVRALGAFLGAARRLHGMLDDALQSSVAVSHAWFELLLGIADTPDQRLLIGELGRRLSLTSGGVTRFVDRVEAAGLVARVPSPDDRRALYVTLTDRGRDVVARGSVVLRGVYLDELVGPLTKTERSVITAALPRIAGGPGSPSGSPVPPSGTSRAARPATRTPSRPR